ncbi:MAG: sulfite exporter TauE/SafE family protein [Anaerolineae bacterium]
MTALLIAAVVFLASLLQSLSGFGFAIVIMPVLTLMLGLKTAAPLVALIALTVYVVNVTRFRRAIRAGEVLRLGLASAMGVPVGIWALSSVEEAVVKDVLGLLLLLFAAYGLLRPTTSWVPSPRWVYPADFFAGCLGGAYNTPGPPAIVYGTLRQWPRDEFRAVMQSLFLVNGALVVTSHLVTRHVTMPVLTYYLCALPALALGILLASRLDSRVDHGRFRTLVMVTILLLGSSLLLSS